MPTPVSLAFDISNWSAIPTTAQLQCLWNKGYRRVIVGASYGEIADEQMKVCHAFGFEVQAYAWIVWSNPIPALAKAYKAISGIPVTRMWLDLEGDTNVPAEQLVQQVNYSIDHCRQWRPDLPLGIYTGGWWFKAYMRNLPVDFGLPLWFANYRNPTGVDVANLLFGAWDETEVDMWQYSNVEECGLNIDRNIVYAREDDMTPEQVNQIIREYVDPKVMALYLNAVQNGKDILTHGAQIQALGTAFIEHVAQGGIDSPELKAMIEDIATKQKDLEKRVKEAATALTGTP